MIDALEAQIAPLDKELRAYARRQAGCKALMAHYGIGALVAVTILAELGDCTRFSSSRHAVRYAGHGHHRAPVRSAPRARAPVAARARRRCAGRCSRPPRSPAGRAAPTATTTPGGRSGSVGNRACLSVARKLLKRSYHTLRELGEEALAARMTFPVRAKPFVTPMRRGRLPACSCRHHPVDGPERPSGRNASPSGITPSNIMSPAPEPTRGSRTEVRLGARAHTHPHHQPRARTPSQPQFNPDNPGPCA